MTGPQQTAHLGSALWEWRWRIPVFVLGMAVLASFARVAADWDWAVAMGRHIAVTRSIPDEVPFAHASTSGWHDVPVLGQLLAAVLEAGGPRVVVVAHLILVMVSIMLLMSVARPGPRVDLRGAMLLAVVVLGALPALALVRLQTFSLVPFALMLVLVIRQSRHPDRRIWWAPLLIAVWGNLHGAVLLGVCVLGAYLLVDRLRHRTLETVVVGGVSLGALLLTPQGLDTSTYYRSVFANEAAERGEGLWAPVDLNQPFDVLMVVALVVLLLTAWRSQLQPWEWVVVLGLGAATFTAARHGTWLVLSLYPFVLCKAPVDGPDVSGQAETPRAFLPPAAGAVMAGLCVVGIVLERGADTLQGAHPEVVRAVTDRAGPDTVVLAPSTVAERLAVEGVTVWAGNPIDAFDPADQAAYLDFLQGLPGMQRAVDGADLVVTEDGTAAGDALGRRPDLVHESCADGWTCHRPR